VLAVVNNSAPSGTGYSGNFKRTSQTDNTTATRFCSSTKDA